MEVGHRGNGSGEDKEASNSRKGKKPYHRHTSNQIQQLEAFFKECAHPDENQRRQLSRDLGLEPRQIKFWFQNKRTQIKAQNERAGNNVLRAENEKIQTENLAIREALKNVICPDCGGPPFGDEERRHCLERLQMENAQLKGEHERLSNLVSKCLGKPVTQIISLSPSSASSLDLSKKSFHGWGVGGTSLDLDLVSGDPNSGTLPCKFHMKGDREMEKSLMIRTAVSAMDELIKLLRVNEPVWVRSPSGGRYVLHQDSIDKLFPWASQFKSSSARIESSKYSGVVMMTGIHLVDKFLDSDKWADLFPTIVRKAQTIEVLDTGMLGNQGDSLQLMYQQMHILSPLVAPREFFFLRFCQKLEPGVWVVVDVSYDCSRDNLHASPLRSWRLPSGCMIQDMTNGYSRITWVELMEVDDKSLTHRLYRDLVYTCSAYGAERWVVTLQRMCERFAYSMGESPPCNELGAINKPEGRRCMMKLSHRMVKKFCSVLSMSDKLDFPHLSELTNSGVRVSVRKSDEPGQPSGIIVSAATSLWLPLSFETLFSFFRDEKLRSQWDVLCNGNPVHEIVNISSGIHPGNCVSIIQPFVPSEKNMLMLQECCIDSLGAIVVYAPIDIPAIKSAISGEDPTNILVLPSGLTISSDGHSDKVSGTSTHTSTGKSSGSLLTVAFQILVCSQLPSRQLNMESVATVNTLVSSTVQKIKMALDCSNLH